MPVPTWQTVQELEVNAGVAKNFPFTGRPYPNTPYNATGTNFLITIFK